MINTGMSICCILKKTSLVWIITKKYIIKTVVLRFKKKEKKGLIRGMVS